MMLKRIVRYFLLRLFWLLIRCKNWLNLPRILGLIAITLGLAHYLPIRFLSTPILIKLHGDMAPELISIGLTLILIDWAIERRQEKYRKSQLIKELGSKYRDITEMAIIELRHKGWLQDGSLREAYLSGANLKGANLGGANLKRANLWGLT